MSVEVLVLISIVLIVGLTVDASFATGVRTV